MGGKNAKPAASPLATRTTHVTPRAAASDDWVNPDGIQRLIKEVLRGSGTKFSETSDHIIAIYDVKGETVTMIFDYHHSNNCLSIYFMLQKRVTAAAQRSPGGITEFVARANYSLLFGFFDVLDGHVRYTHSTNMADMRREIALSKVAKMIKIVHMTFDHYLPGILDTFAGNDPSNMCLKVERSGYSHESVEQAKHFGLSCNSCRKQNFEGRAYKCDVCSDYFLCESCQSQSRTTNSHSSSHRMSEQPLPRHKHTTCDYCFAEGFYVPRYKCDVCDDYDLCQFCHQSNKTNKHHTSGHSTTRFCQPRSVLGEVFGLVDRRAPAPVHPGVQRVSRPSPVRANDSIGSITSIGSNGSGGRDDRINPHHLKLDRSNRKNLLGRGGMGEVWRGQYHLADVAIKLVLPENSDSAEHTDRFKDEYCLHVGLVHPNIVQVLGWCMYDDNLCLVAEYCGRGSLCRVLERERDMPYAQRMSLALGTAAGMHYLHEAGILHLDLKPDNLFVTDGFIVKVGDFGLSQKLKTRTHASNVNAGTLLYMAPELLATGSRATKRTDCYAFSLVLFEIFVGQPYLGESLDLRFVMQMVSSNRRPKFHRDISPPLRTLITELWDTNPETRPLFDESHYRLKALERA